MACACVECAHRVASGGYYDLGVDWICEKAGRKIAVFIEGPRDYPNDTPVWCPLLSEACKKQYTSYVG